MSKRVKTKTIKTVQPYTWEYNGVYVDEPTDLQVFIYNEERYIEKTAQSFEDILPLLQSVNENDMVWFNIHGLNDPAIFPKIAAFFDVPLSTLNEVLIISRRSRVETQEGLLFFNLKTTVSQLFEDKIEIIPISFIIKDNLLLSFQDKKNALFEHIRERIRTKVGSVRRKQEDFLLYLLLEAITENTFLSLDEIEDKVDIILNDTKKSHNIAILNAIQYQSNNLNEMKRAMLPLKDVVFNIRNININEEVKFLDPVNQVYFNRMYHKVLEILDQIDYDIKQLDNASNYYFSMQSHRMNNIMKVLTIVSVIFMPLTFIVGVYGMNFDVMPELRYKYGYYTVMIVMFLLVVIMVYYFKRKRWF